MKGHGVQSRGSETAVQKGVTTALGLEGRQVSVEDRSL